ncbi:hypothetical protein HYV50_00670 [Candidatus Pacearchaeota archaeon]|nr:hypothetical protein [Candidatus Pacearchaeota archaeon]
MAEIVVKVEVPKELKKKFEIVLTRVMKQFERSIRFAVLDEIMSKSKLTDEQIWELSKELKERVAKRHGL